LFTLNVNSYASGTVKLQISYTNSARGSGVTWVRRTYKHMRCELPAALPMLQLVQEPDRQLLPVQRTSTIHAAACRYVRCTSWWLCIMPLSAVRRPVDGPVKQHAAMSSAHHATLRHQAANWNTQALVHSM